jgi:hypothetical protein
MTEVFLRRRFGQVAISGLLAGFSLALSLIDLPASAQAAPPAAETIRLVIDFGDGVELHFTRLPWKQGMTVVDAMGAAAAMPHGVKFEQIGAGETALVTKIGDVKNEGSGRDRRNWLYDVNGKPAEVGAGALELKPGDVVLWKFDRYGYNSSKPK